MTLLGWDNNPPNSMDLRHFQHIRRTDPRYFNLLPLRRYKTVQDFVIGEKQLAIGRIQITAPRNWSYENEVTAIKHMPFICIVDVSIVWASLTKSYGTFLTNFVDQVLGFLSAGIIPIYIFDGKPPEEKKKLIASRKKKTAESKKKRIEAEITLEKLTSLDDITEQVEALTLNVKKEVNKFKRKEAYLTSENIQQVQQILTVLGLPFYTAKGEGDALCVKMENELLCSHFTISTDTDFMPRGAKQLVEITSDGVTVYETDHIMKYLGLTPDQFIDLCILLGNDYIPRPTATSDLRALDIYFNLVECGTAMQTVDNYASCYTLTQEQYDTVRKLLTDNDETFDKESLINKLLHMVRKQRYTPERPDDITRLFDEQKWDKDYLPYVYGRYFMETRRLLQL